MSKIGASETKHIPVMLDESIEAFRGLGAEESLVIDCTVGGGGHTLGILNSYPTLKVLAFDRDERAIARTGKKLSHYIDNRRLKIEHCKFSTIEQKLRECSVFKAIPVRGVLADLGISTDQLTENRGFSFKDDSSLDMRMDEFSGISALEFINSSSFFELEKVLKIGGVRKAVRPIVKGLLRSRPIGSARELADVVVNSIPSALKRNSNAHPATVVFQAIRVWVNGEFDELDKLLSSIPNVLKDGGICCIISFHSLEDKRVARTMRYWQSGDTLPPSVPGFHLGKSSLGRIITPKAITPTQEEIKQNPASRSALMRIFRFDSK